MKKCGYNEVNMVHWETRGFHHRKMKKNYALLPEEKKKCFLKTTLFLQNSHEKEQN